MCPLKSDVSHFQLDEETYTWPNMDIILCLYGCLPKLTPFVSTNKPTFDSLMFKFSSRYTCGNPIKILFLCSPEVDLFKFSCRLGNCSVMTNWRWSVSLEATIWLRLILWKCFMQKADKVRRQARCLLK